MFKNIKRHIAVWLFIHKIGKVSKAYEQLTEQTYRTAYAIEQFGRAAYGAEQERAMR